MNPKLEFFIFLLINNKLEYYLLLACWPHGLAFLATWTCIFGHMVVGLLLGGRACTVPSLWDPFKARGRGVNHVVPQPGGSFPHKILLEFKVDFI